MPERLFCATEQMAVAPVPSLTSNEPFDSGVVLEDGPLPACGTMADRAMPPPVPVETLTPPSPCDAMNHNEAVP